MITRRRARLRLRALDTRKPDPASRHGVSNRLQVGLLGRLGHCAEGVFIATRPSVPDPGGSRLRGAVVLGAAGMAVVSPILGLCFGLVGWHLPAFMARSREQHGARRLEEDVLLATELCAVAFRTGASVPEAVGLVNPFLPVSLRPAFQHAHTDFLDGTLLDDALVHVIDDLGDPVVPLVALLRAAHVDGDPILPALDRLTDRLHARHRRAVEADVRRLSIRLLLPLVCCSLPGFVLIGVVPLVVSAFGGITR